MNRQSIIAVVLFALLLVSGQVLTAAPLGPGFTYQGQLEENGGPAAGPANLRFSLWDAAVDGNQIGVSQIVADIPVTNGLFVVTLNEANQFGTEAFNGDECWLQLEDCPDGACAAPEVFLPRQPLTGVPYAHYAASAPWSGVTGIPEGFADGVDNSADPVWEVTDTDVTVDTRNVGIGTDTPHHRLRISGGPIWTSNGWTGSLELDNAAAIGWRSNPGGRRSGIGQSNGGLFFFNTESDPGTALSPANYAMTINDSGRIGIGPSATNPDFPLTINTGSIGYGLVHTDGIHEVGTFLNAKGGWLGTRSDHPLHLFTHDSQPQLTINTSGSVGIGTDTPAGGTKLHVVHNTAGYAILGNAPNGNGVVGTNALPGNGATAGINSAQDGVGVFGQADLGSLAAGVYGFSVDGIGTLGASTRNVGVKGTSTNSIGVQGVSASSPGVEGRSDSGEGVYGYSYSSYGVSGYSSVYIGVRGESAAGINAPGVWGKGFNGVEAISNNSEGSALYAHGGARAGTFVGDVDVFGVFTDAKSTVRMDHPLDPENKVLSHSSVDSPDMMNIYNGNVITDATGYAEIMLPNYFEALNKDFRYQLTVIDDANSEDFVQAKVVKRIKGNQFTIRTSRPNVAVSWLVTGVRQDAYAKAHPIEVEKAKPEKDRGKYLAPEVFGQPKEMGIHYRPELERSSETASRGE